MQYPSLPPELEMIRDHVEKSVRRSVVLAPAGPAETYRTRFGGRPALPPGASWPRSDRGPLSFLGQLDFSELAPAGGEALGLPVDGILSVFYDLETHPRGTRPYDRHSWRLIYTDGATEPVSAPEGALTSPEEPLQAHAALSIPRPGDLSMLGWAAVPERAPWFPAYGEFSEAFTLSQGPLPPLAGFQQQVRGYADWLRGDARPIAALAAEGLPADPAPPLTMELARNAARWTLLWQLKPQTDAMTWMDIGTLYVLMRRDDLRHRAFDHAWLVFQSS